METTTNSNGSITPTSDLNPFSQQRAQRNATTEVESQRAIAEAQAAIMLAKRFPRDQVAAVDRIIQAFTRQTLAETALYSYARGGTDVTGPSIRAAETIAQNWGNFQFGVRELEQRNGESTVEAYAWDVETNTRSVKTFQVPHVRYSRDKGNVRLNDPRDVYEMIANQGARRLRACILSVIPGDVVEAAISQAETTLRTKVEITPDLIQSILDKFSAIGVSRAALEHRLQRRVEAITPALVVQLGKIHNSIKDGMSGAGDWFDLKISPSDDAGQSRASSILDKIKDKTAVEPASETPSVAAEAMKAEGPKAVIEPTPSEEPEPVKPMSDTQARVIQDMAKDRGVDSDALAEIVGEATEGAHYALESGISYDQAAAIMDRLKDIPRAAKGSRR